MENGRRGDPLSFYPEHIHTRAGRFAPVAYEVALMLSPERDSCLVSVSAGSCGWSLGDRQGSSGFLKAFRSCWEDRALPIRPQWRLLCAVKGAIRKHFAGQPAYVPEDPDVLGPPWLCLAAVHLCDKMAHCVWVGGEEIFCWLGKELVWSNHPGSRRRVDGAAQQGERPRMHSADIALQSGMRLMLTNYQWPRRRSALEYTQLWCVSERLRLTWCKQHKREYLSMISCQFL